MQTAAHSHLLRATHRLLGVRIQRSEFRVRLALRAHQLGARLIERAPRVAQLLGRRREVARHAVDALLERSLVGAQLPQLFGRRRVLRVEVAVQRGKEAGRQPKQGERNEKGCHAYSSWRGGSKTAEVENEN